MSITTNNTNFKTDAVLFGIKFQKKWHMLDIGGEIIDKIMKDKKSPFIDNYFKEVGAQQLQGNSLRNQETECLMSINVDDLIFKHTFDDEKEILKGKDLNWFFDTITSFLIPEIVIKYNYDQIMRFGIIYYHRVQKIKLNQVSISQFVHPLSGDLAKFSLDFHIKLPTEEGLKKGTFDNKNIIHFIRNIDEENCEVGIDYQYYFRPFIDEIKDFNIMNYLTSSKDYLETKFKPWFNNKFENK